MNQAKESKAAFLQPLEGTAGEVICLLFYFLQVTARKKWSETKLRLSKKKNSLTSDSLEQKEVVRSHFVPPQIGSTY